jgi:VanZ family protein
VGKDREEDARRVSAEPTGRSRLLLWAPVALLLAFEFYLSSLSVLPKTRLLTIPGGDKIAHGGYFFGMASCAVRAARFGTGWSRRRTLLTIVLAAALYGCVDEFHQSFVPMRDVEAADVVADTRGALLAALFAERLWRKTPFERAPAP